MCGAAAARRASVLVEDVQAFPGHIACDLASRSDRCRCSMATWSPGVFDLDSPVVARFSAEDQACIEQAVRLWVQGSSLYGWPLPPAAR